MASTYLMDASWQGSLRIPAGAGAVPAASAGVAAKVLELPSARRARTAPPPSTGAADALQLAQLIRRMSFGEESALAALYDAAVSRVHGLALRIVRDSAAAEEVVIDTFHQAWRDAARFDATRGTPLAWLLMICRSRAIDHVRARDPAVAHDDPEALRHADDIGCERDPLELVVAMQSHAALRTALTQLSPAQRQMLGLAFFRGLTHEEIAAQAAVPLGTVKSQIRRALATLRRELAGPSGEAP